MDLEQVQRNSLLKWMMEHLRTYGMDLQEVEDVMAKSGYVEQEGGVDVQPMVMLTKVTILCTPPMSVKPAAPLESFARLLEDSLQDFKEALSPHVSKSRTYATAPNHPQEVKTPARWLLIHEVTLNRKVNQLPTFTVVFDTLPRPYRPPCRRDPKWI